MKLIGIVMIISACSFLGFIAAQKYDGMLKDIKRSEMLIRNIIFCLKNEHMSIRDIFDYICESADEKTKNFLEALSPGYFENIGETALNCGFCKNSEALAVLSGAFAVLGKYSAKDQIRELEHCREKLILIYENNCENLKNKAKFSRKAGMITGLFAAVILL
ncbi:MAG: stage III sporulation protein AB [Oscillospiraceae bacterium]|nr:stage III sporulation protein AB [Oscillospiraceae bacterium]